MALEHPDFLYRQRLKTRSTVQVAATGASFPVSILTSSLLLAPRQAGSFSGAGLLLHNAAPKSVRKGLDEFLAGVTFDPSVAFWSVCVTVSCCFALRNPPPSRSLRTGHTVEDEVSGRAARRVL